MISDRRDSRTQSISHKWACVAAHTVRCAGATLATWLSGLRVYQLPAFLLLRYVGAVRQGVAGLATLALVSFFIPVPAGLFVEAASFILLLLVIDAFANSGRSRTPAYHWPIDAVVD